MDLAEPPGAGPTDATLCQACPAHRPVDPLTGLADRRQFLAALAGAVAAARPPDQGAANQLGLALLMIDLDRFKAVNDALGHPAGDAVLRSAGNRLRSGLRPGDLVARLGGDEFAVLLAAPVDRAVAAAVAARFVDLLGRPFIVSGRVAQVGASVGIAMLPPAATTAEALLGHADMALYQAKALGRGRFGFFHPDLQDRAEARRVLEQELRAALPLGQLELHYQPQFDLQDDRLCGFEALVRWRHPARGLVPPDQFIPVAEEIGMIAALGNWVLRTACAEALRWPGEVLVAVNVSARQFEAGGVARNVAAILAETGLPGHRLELEITETALLRCSPAGAEGEGTMGQLRALAALGVQISLDDFGTGYASLSQLRSFPFNRVKIDRSFADDPPVIRAVAALGASLGIRTTAEGMETPAQLLRVRSEGCTDAQGFLLGRPMPAAEVPAAIARLGGMIAHPGEAAA